MYINNQYITYCQTLQKQNQYRQITSRKANSYHIDFANNDYLALSYNKELIEYTAQAAYLFGIGSTGSRVLSGNHEIFNEFEQQIAYDKKTETALLWPSGFIANFGTLHALLDSNVLKHAPIVFFDRLNHASLYQAVIEKALHKEIELVRYRHNDVEHLQYLMKQYSHDKRSKFIIIESLYSMDGDIAPLDEILSLSRKYQAFLYIDEAHATGILGTHGYGLSTNYDLSDISYILMGTFSKALGSIGGYIATSHVVKNYLINKAKAFIYSTAPSPMMSAISHKAWLMIANMSSVRTDLLSKATILRSRLTNLGFNIGSSESHIIPIILGQELVAQKAEKLLLENGIRILAVRPPTVPPNTSRLRIALNVKHTLKDIEQLLSVLKCL